MGIFTRGRSMSVEPIAISVIIPAYNESAYIAQALESVLFQRTDFGVEIIVVDDCSTDDTVAIVERYQQQFPQITLLKNAENQGKGYSFRRAYAEAKGQYFHVLDGDDYFIRYDKLQKQKDFLDSHAECVAVCHNSIRLFNDEQIFFERRERKPVIYRYEDCIRKTFYCHTSTYLYRKIEPELPEVFLQRPMRGDDSCFFYHVYKSKGAVGYLPDIASVYRFHGEGIWTSMTQEKQAQLTLDMLRLWCEEIITDKQSLEYQLVRARYDFHAKTAGSGEGDKPHYETYSLDALLTYCQRSMQQAFQLAEGAQLPQRAFGAQKIDEICEMAGRVLLNEQGFTYAKREYDANRVVVLTSALPPSDERVAEEMRERVRKCSEEGKEVFILSSTPAQASEATLKSYSDLGNVHIWQAKQGSTLRDKAAELMAQMDKVNAACFYPFIAHDDVAACAAVQNGLAGEIVWGKSHAGVHLGLRHSTRLALDAIELEEQDWFHYPDAIFGKTQSRLALFGKVLHALKQPHFLRRVALHVRLKLLSKKLA
jgi:glycosyltransferase involved in cell wall biosynthesis